jgi:hypothetical protein
MKELNEIFGIEGKKFRKFRALELRLAFTGFVAIGVIILQVWISAGTPDFASKISLIALSISIPTLVFALLIPQIPGANPKELSNVIFTFVALVHTLFGTIGALGIYLGTITAIYHASPIAGILFALSSMTCFYVYVTIKFIVWRHIKNMKKVVDQKTQ